MRPTDIRIVDATIEFRQVRFAVPLRLSSGPIEVLTEARVSLVAANRAGRVGRGLGSVLLSYPWAYDGPVLATADDAMRAAVRRLAERATGLTGDPLSIGVALLDLLPALPLPRLAAEVCLGPVDQAVHDAWSRAAGTPAWRLYTREHVPDLGEFLGPDFVGRYPGDFLRSAPVNRLPVQHVIGVGDATDHLTGARWLKVKLAGKDPAADAARVAEIATTGARLALDPNEGYASDADLAALVTALPDHATVDYIEQPVPRSVRIGPAGCGVPVLLDEGLPDPRRLDEVTGWDGIVVKTCRGQTATLLAYCWARHRGRYVVQQDLTHVGPALEHAAAFAAHTVRSVPAFECNSLRYAPAGNAELATRRPGLVTVTDGWVDVSDVGKGGIR